MSLAEEPQDLGLNDEQQRRLDAIPHVPDFDLQGKIHRKIESLMEVNETLERRFSVAYAMPNITGKIFEPPRVEMVPIERVRGGANNIDPRMGWFVSDADTRGPERIWELIQSLQGEDPILRKGGRQLHVYEINGKYWVVEGRHRVAALKVLGVEQVPMLVTHVKEAKEDM
jgi:hypothetical protein